MWKGHIYKLAWGANQPSYKNNWTYQQTNKPHILFRIQKAVSTGQQAATAMDILHTVEKTKQKNTKSQMLSKVDN